MSILSSSNVPSLISFLLKNVGPKLLQKVSCVVVMTVDKNPNAINDKKSDHDYTNAKGKLGAGFLLYMISSIRVMQKGSFSFVMANLSDLFPVVPLKEAMVGDVR